jgi:hypothetical protein
MRIIITIFLMYLSILCNAQGPGGPPGPPSGNPPCWPPSSCDPSIPINNELILLIIAGLCIVVWYYKIYTKTYK